MIEYLRGTLRGRLPSGVIVDVNGVGYGVELPLNVLCEVPPINSDVEFWIYTRVREDSFRLYGFTVREDRAAFEVLLQISGIGPKVALAILSTLTLARLRAAVEGERIDWLEGVPGIGRRTAEKILVELKSKLEKLPIPHGGSQLGADRSAAALASHPEVDVSSTDLTEDLTLALMSLGFKEKEISTVIKKVGENRDACDFSSQLKLALHYIRGGLGPKSGSSDKSSPARPPLEGLF